MISNNLPLVSILIPNYNHSRYLDECIQSALNQTYPNKEIIVLDNMSTDNSLQVLRKYEKKGVIICRNQRNIMNFSYKVLANNLCGGKYFILLCADDYLLPDYLEKTVSLMEKYPSLGYVHAERDFITENGEIIELDPFYNCSFVAPGRNTMPIYMITTVAHPAQGLIRKTAFDSIGGYDMEIDHMNADRSMWYFLSYSYDAGYVREKLCRIRVGTQTETSLTKLNFQHPMLCHLTLNVFIKFAKEKGLDNVLERREEAIERLAKEFVGYAGEMINGKRWGLAERYLEYARILNRNINETNLFKRYENMCYEEKWDDEFLLENSKVSFYHKRNYQPPEGYTKISIGEAGHYE